MKTLESEIKAVSIKKVTDVSTKLLQKCEDH